MDPEVARFVEYLDDRIRALQEIKDSIVERFAEEGSLHKRLLRAPSGSDLIQPNPNLFLGAGSHGNGSRGQGTRKEQTANFVRAHGACTRTEIREGTGIPVGTLATVLNDKTMFRNRNGKWHLVAEQKGSAE